MPTLHVLLPLRCVVRSLHSNGSSCVARRLEREKVCGVADLTGVSIGPDGGGEEIQNPGRGSYG